MRARARAREIDPLDHVMAEDRRLSREGLDRADKTEREWARVKSSGSIGDAALVAFNMGPSGGASGPSEPDPAIGETPRTRTREKITQTPTSEQMAIAREIRDTQGIEMVPERYRPFLDEEVE